MIGIICWWIDLQTRKVEYNLTESFNQPVTGEIFINAILQKGREAKEKANLEFPDISFEQLNWKSSSESWSIAECLEHLVIADSAYFPDLKNIAEGNFKMDLWEKYSPFTRLCGRLMKDRLQGQVKNKMTAPKKNRPQRSDKDLSLIEDYCKNLDAFLRLISYCKKVDVDKTIITSPTIRIVTYSLRDALSFLIQHEHRHINQAIRVKTNQGFPQNELMIFSL